MTLKKIAVSAVVAISSGRRIAAMVTLLEREILFRLLRNPTRHFRTHIPQTDKGDLPDHTNSLSVRDFPTPLLETGNEEA